jgi:hypothetical protein
VNVHGLGDVGYFTTLDAARLLEKARRPAE